MTTMNLMTRAIRPDDNLAIKELYDKYFSQFDLYYGHKLESEFLERRVFTSMLYETDCSMVQLCKDSQIKAVILANQKLHPNQSSSNDVYLNQLLVVQDNVGMECGRQLISNLLKAAKLSGKARVITSLQWGGIWPGVLTEDVNLQKVLQDTGGQITNGEVFAQSNISELISTCRSSCRPLPSGITIRPYLDSDAAGLIQLISLYFSIGWMHETLCKVGLSNENFNGYGLTKTYRPMDVLIVNKGCTVCGFCVVQSVTNDNTSFFGPIGLAPDVRGKGIGLYLLLKAIEYLSERDKTTTGLWTSESIYCRFYANLGMKISMNTHHYEWNLRSD